MMTEKTKTIILIIGVILACLLLIQGISLGFGNSLITGHIEISSDLFTELLEVRKAGLRLF